MNKEPKNVTRSKRIIKNALLELLEKKNPHEIKIIELTNLADINRGTFYAHYNNIFDVISEIENDMLDDFFHPLEATIASYEDSLLILKKLLEFIYENKKKYQQDCKRNIFPLLTQKCKARVYQILLGKSTDKYSPEFELVNRIKISYFVSGYMGLIDDWTNDEFSGVTPEDLHPIMVDFLNELHFEKAFISF